MITRIELEGFKSLQGFTMDLGPFTAMIGPNGAGKSNVLDALGLLARLASGDLATALSGGRGRIREQLTAGDGETRKQGFGPLGRIAIAVELLLFEQEALFTRLRYEVAIELSWLPSGIDRCTLASERLSVLSQDDPWMARHPWLADRARHAASDTILSWDGAELSVNDPASVHASRSAVQHVPARAHLAEPALWAASPHLRAVAAEMRRIRVVHLEPRLLREPSERGAPAMTAEGAYLATELAALPPDGLARVRARLASLVAGTRTVEIVPHDDTLQIELELTDGRRFSSRVLSDGTLRILGVLALLESSRGSGLLAIEAPENGVHASRVRLLAGVLRDAVGASGERDVEPAQIVITSYSPAMLAPLLERPEDIVCIDMVRLGMGPRFTRARRTVPRDEADPDEKTVSVQELEKLLATALIDLESGGP